MTAPWLEDDVLVAARSLLGWRIVSDIGGERVAGAITEVEAYAGEDDPASHAFNGRTPRNGVMFGPAGGLYVYRSYGIHWCMNVVLGPEGVALAVLLRGAELDEGVDVALRRRGRSDHLADGPGKLTQALGVTGEHDGHHVDASPLRIVAPIRRATSIEATPRIGISKAIDREWRFVVSDWEGAPTG